MMVEKLSTRSDSPAYRNFPVIVEKINELCDAINDILDQKTYWRQLHDAAEKRKPFFSVIKQPDNLIGENIELKAENLRLQQDLDRVCKKKFEEVDAAVRESNKNLFAKNEKLNAALNHCVKTFKSLEQVLNEKASASDIPDNPDLYAWAVRIKPIWSELKEITGIDYTKGGDNE